MCIMNFAALWFSTSIDVFRAPWFSTKDGFPNTIHFKGIVAVINYSPECHSKPFKTFIHL